MDYDELLDDLDHWRGVHPRAAKAIRALLAERDAMLAAAPSPAWIKVSERLPTKNDSDERGYVWTYCNLFWVRLENWHSIMPATHWMPKPRVQPPSPPEVE